MALHDCPYCSLAKKKGELFCSRHSSNMSDLKSGVFFIESKLFEECDWHVTRLSLNFNFDGRQEYCTASRSFTVSPEKYLLLNEGQSFKTSCRSDQTHRMITIAFEVGLAEKLLSAMTMNEHQLTDDPFRSQNNSTSFLEKTYSPTTNIHSSVSALIRPDFLNDVEIDQTLEDVLTNLVAEQLDVRREILSIAKSRPATRLEIYKRLHWSLDFLHDHFHTELSIEQLAKEACLSTFHYKRLFTELFKISPYQYLIKLRLEKACSLLNNQMLISDVCKHVGWKDPSSFARLFKRRFRVTPDQFRGVQSR